MNVEMNPFARVLALFAILSSASSAQDSTTPGDASALVLHVDRNGRNDGVGTIEAPFASLEAARDHLRTLRAGARPLPSGPITVYLREGVYRRDTPFVLGPDDGGSEGSPVVYRSFPGERVRLSGGIALSAKDLETVTDPAILNRVPPSVHDAIRKIDLRKAGVTMEQFGEIQYWQKGGLKYPVERGAVWIDGKKLVAARYPKANGGPAGDGFVLTGEVLHTGSIPRHGVEKFPAGGVFQYTDEEVASWAAHENVWLHGYMKETYADGTLRIQSVDTEAGTIAVEQPSWYGIGEGGRYFYLNVLEHLSLPGESWMDRENEAIYLIPPSRFRDDSVVELSVSREPLLRIDGASHCVISGIDFLLTRSDAIQVEHGSGISVENLEIRQIEGNGVVMPKTGVTDNSLVEVSMTQVGGYPFRIGGGDLLTQSGGNSLVSHCRFRHFGLNRSGKSQLGGVGNVVRNSDFSHCKEGALAVSGNENLVEYNRFRYLNREGSDAGAVYMGRNPSETGTRIRYNYFQDIGNGIEEDTGIQGVYVDDRSGFVEVHGNIFNRVGSGKQAAAFKVNGGKFNAFTNNIVIDGRAVYIQVHSTTPEQWAGWYRSKEIAAKLDRVDAENPESPWARLYPQAFEVARTGAMAPTTSNIVKNNIVIRGELCHGIIGGRYGDPLPEKSGNQVVDHDPGFSDLEGGDLSIPKRIMELEFPSIEWIDFDRIGP